MTAAKRPQHTPLNSDELCRPCWCMPGHARMHAQGSWACRARAALGDLRGILGAPPLDSLPEEDDSSITPYSTSDNSSYAVSARDSPVRSGRVHRSDTAGLQTP